MNTCSGKYGKGKILHVTACEQPLQLASKNHTIKSQGISEEAEVLFNGKLVKHEFYIVELPDTNIILFRDDIWKKFGLAITNSVKF